MHLLLCGVVTGDRRRDREVRVTLFGCGVVGGRDVVLPSELHSNICQFFFCHTQSIFLSLGVGLDVSDRHY